jgi:hypothetical protein
MTWTFDAGPAPEADRRSTMRTLIPTRRPTTPRRGRTALLAIASMAIATLVAAGLVTAPASAADTSSAAVAAANPMDCFHVGFTIKDGDFVRGSGSYGSGCGIRQIKVELYQSCWGWCEVDEERLLSPGSRGVSYDCYGDGTYTYKTVVWGITTTGAQLKKESNQPRFAC